MSRFLFLLLTISGLAAPQPNVIVLITDDQGYGDLSAHGNPVLKTPQLDRLHGESVRFTDFHVAPMCSPTRGQLMTGLDAMRNGCTAVCQGRSMMRSELPTMAHFFAESGYATGHFGKWHLGDSYPHRPQDRGFQETIHHRAWGITSLADFWGNNYFDPVLEHNGVDKKFTGYCTDIFFNESMKWIKSCQAADKPFFLYLPTNTPHVPNVCDAEYSAPYKGSFEGKPIPDTFYGMIANIDENVGKLDAFLKDSGLRDNTIFIFLSDNGTQSQGAKAIYNAGMRNKKTSVHEGGHRVPCFVRWPNGNLKHGQDIDELTQVQDLLPTLIELCELRNNGHRFDGGSLTGLLRGEADQLPDRKLVVQYRVSGDAWNPAVVLWKKWRLTRPNTLYHVGRDPGQTENVVAKHPEVAQAMAAHYDAWHAQTKPIFDTPRWITIGSPAANPMLLYAQDWTGGYCDNHGGLFQGKATGYWNVIADKAGVYELELRRWPKESKLALNAGFKGRGARPIVAANLQIGGATYTVDAAAEDSHVPFRVRLAAGKNQLATAMLDADDRTLCSAMYVTVTRLADANKQELTSTSDRKPKTGPTAKEKPANSATKADKPAATFAAGDILIADFEGDDYADWTASGSAFGAGPVEPNGRVTGHAGSKLLDTFLRNGSDKPTGKLVSPSFTIQRPRIHLRVGGGNQRGSTCVNLVIDGKTVHSAVGTALKDENKRKIMNGVTWDVRAYKGKTAQIHVIDEASDGWGHIMVDQIFQSKN
ncbi:MAG: arylsulfatase A-like enzyme [Rhodothermales bacterium]|jgi:arylsulfatase A-like enzyme